MAPHGVPKNGRFPEQPGTEKGTRPAAADPTSVGLAAAGWPALRGGTVVRPRGDASGRSDHRPAVRQAGPL